MDFYNDQCLLTVTTEDGRRRYRWRPRWIAVTVSRDEQDHVFATPEGYLQGQAWRVDVHRCKCGHEYVERHGSDRTPRCRLCENAQRAAEQRRRRARARTLATACTVCGAPLSARRSSRKYCSPACRQRAHRQRAAAIHTSA